MHLFHVAERAAWEAARAAGAYAISTRGRTLDDEGFIHAAHEHQVAGVLERHWAGHPGPLVLLVIDTDRLNPPWREEQVGTESFPHIHGPVNLGAVLEARPLPRTTPAAVPPAAGTPAQQGGSRTFAQAWLAEFSFRAGWAVAVMALAVVLGILAAEFVHERAGLLGMAAGLAIGVAVVVPVNRRRKQRATDHP